MDCDKLVTNINPCATTTPFRRWEEVGYIIPYADIRNVVISGADVNFDTVGNAYSVRDRRTTPFAGSGSEFVRGDKGSVTFTERVNFPALANSVENATIANMLANGGRVVVILKQLDYESTGKGKYQVFGIDGGLRIDTEPFDPYADAAWDITLIAERTAQSAVYLWDTDEATTDAKFILFVDYEYIAGLSLADGSVTPQVIYLQVDADKTCKVVLPDGTILTSTGGIINDTWTGAAGAVTLIVSKTNGDVGMSTSDFVGSLLVTSATGEIDLSVCTGITSLSAPNATNLDCHGCTSLTSISAPNAVIFYCYNCPSLTSLSAPNATNIGCSNCTLLTSISVPNVISLDCYDCTSLTSLSAPNATNLDCHGCTSLTSVSAPNATELYCYGCTSLTSLSAPNATNLGCSDCTLLTSISAPNAISLECYSCTSLISISAPNATAIDASGCALPPDAIQSFLFELYTTGKMNGTLDISGGTNADITYWYEGYYVELFDDLIINGWNITYNGEL